LALAQAAWEKEMILTDRQRDSLGGLFSSAFGRAAAALADVTGRCVDIHGATVEVHPLADLQRVLNGVLKGDVATISQAIAGRMVGNALLLLSYEDAVILSGSLTGARVPVKRLDASGREVLSEVGNIVLNASLSALAELLQVSVSSSVPRLRIETCHALLSSLTIAQVQLRYALVVSGCFVLGDSSLGTTLMIALGGAGLDLLLQLIDRQGLSDDP
jgi:chemotaxis protein CheC